LARFGGVSCVVAFRSANGVACYCISNFIVKANDIIATTDSPHRQVVNQ